MGTSKEPDRDTTETPVSNLPESGVLSFRNDDRSLDLLFRAIEKRECRLVVYYLTQREEAMPVVELAKLIAASTLDKAPETLSSDEIARTFAALSTNHLPTLEEAGIVHCDGPLVSLCDDPSPARAWLETTFEIEVEEFATDS